MKSILITNQFEPVALTVLIARVNAEGAILLLHEGYHGDLRDLKLPIGILFQKRASGSAWHYRRWSTIQDYLFALKAALTDCHTRYGSDTLVYLDLSLMPHDLYPIVTILCHNLTEEGYIHVHLIRSIDFQLGGHPSVINNYRITLIQMQILRVLRANKETGMTLTEIVPMADMPRTTIGANLAMLERAGYVQVIRTSINNIYRLTTLGEQFALPLESELEED